MHDGFVGPWIPSRETLERIEKTMFNIGMNASGRAYVNACLRDGPSRKVQNHRGNSLVRFTSVRLGIQIMLESRKGEFALAVLADADYKTICFFAQPPQLRLEIKDGSGKINTITPYTPDLLVIRGDEIVALEVRDFTALAQAAMKNPYQFYQDDDGQWHYRAAEEELRKLGIKYYVVSNSSIPSVLVRNIRTLEDYQREDCPPLEPSIACGIAAYVQNRRSVPMPELITHAGFSADEVYKAISSRLVYVDLTSDLLDATSDLIVFADAQTHSVHRRVAALKAPPPIPVPGTMVLRSRSRISYEGKNYRVLLVGERDVLIEDEYGVTSTLPLNAIKHLHELGQLEADGFISQTDARMLSECSTGALERALRRLEAVEKPSESTYSARAICAYRAKVEAAGNRLDALAALVDNQDARGNRRPRVSEKNTELGKQAIKEKYNTPEAGSKRSAFLHYQNLCSEAREDNGQPVHPVSYTTFSIWCEAQKSVLKREGKRANYQKTRIVQSLDNAYPVHGTRPYETLYIDHTVVNLATISPNGVELGKPILTLGIDGHTTHPRALLLTYDPPSARLVLLLLRDYVRRNGRLPDIIMVDNGKEFHSKELALFCKIFNIEIQYRPPSMPRFGAPMERILGATEEEIFAQQQGNTRQMKNPRLVTKSINPFDRATWTLFATYGAVEKYAFEVRPNNVHPALGMTPNEFEAQRLREMGTREHRFVRFDENLMLLTSPHAKRPFHKVDRRRGVWVDGAWYQHPELAKVPKNVKVEVRVEPWLHRVVYVMVGKKWVAATASNSRYLGNRTRREIEISLREEKRKSNEKANKSRGGVKKARQMLPLWGPENFDPRIAEQQKEMLQLYSKHNMTYAMGAQEITEHIMNDSSESFENGKPNCSETSADKLGGTSNSCEKDSNVKLEDGNSSESISNHKLDANFDDEIGDMPGYY